MKVAKILSVALLFAVAGVAGVQYSSSGGQQQGGSQGLPTCGGCWPT